MLQFDRHYLNGSKFIRGSHSKPPTDFVSRNKRAIRDKSRSQATTRNTVNTTATDQRLKGRPTSSRKALVERQQTERKRETREAGGKQAGEGTSSDTVVISKSYLDELLQMSVIVRDEARNKKVTSDQNVRNEVKREESVRHIDINASEVPGLSSASATKHISSRPTEHAQNSATTQQAIYQGHTPHHVTQHSERQATTNNQGLSPREKWLQELAVQVEEQKAKKERNRLLQQQSTIEEYFPFGRPGGGAPIRSQSGALLTDYRSRTRAQDQGGVATQSHLETRKIEDVQSQKESGYFGARYEASHLDGGYVPSHPSANAYRGNINAGIGSGGGGDVMMMSPRRSEAEPQQHNDVYNTTPRFARGAGPHVDQYMRREMDEKRRKQMEHMEFVRQQVAEKERAKLEEKLRREREDALEEARLARERDKMKADFKREKERARRKELEARQRQALLQQRIHEAEESARLAKLEARGVLVNAANHHHLTVSFDEYTAVTRSTESNFLGEGVYSSLSKSDLRSPSMLQLANTTNEAGHHGDGNAPPTQRKGRTIIGRSKATGIEGESEREASKRRNSRIPVMQQASTSKAATTKTSKARTLVSKMQSSKVNEGVRNVTKASTKHVREGGVRQVNGAANSKKTTAVIGRAVISTERSYSPPVPALAKRMKHEQRQQDLPKKHTLHHGHTERNVKENDVNFVRSSSPPVPAVAKKLRNGQLESEVGLTDYARTASPPVPTLAKTMRDQNNVESTSGFVHTTSSVTQPLYERTSSPPVPAVAKRLRNGGDLEAVASNKKNTANEDEKRERLYDIHRASSPPVPTVAKKLQQSELSKLKIVSGKGQPTSTSTSTNAVATNGSFKPIEKLSSDLKLDFSPSHAILAGDSEISINRPPSCKPDSNPLSPVPTTITNLPAIAMAMAERRQGNQGGVVHTPQASNRQRLILQQLTMLKEGILSQQNNIDHRVENILTRNRQCNF